VATSGIGRRRAVAKNEKANPAYLERRREIIDAAARVFRRKGYQGTRLADIAEELGTDRANLYYYVSSKDELFEEAVTEAVTINITRAEDISSGEGSPGDKLRMLIEELMASYARYYPFLYVFIQEDLSHVKESRASWAAEMRSINRRYETVVISLIQQGYDEGSLRDVGPAWVVAYGIIGAVGWTNRWFDPSRSEADAGVIGRTYADMLLNGLTGPL
jgi:AcrR family transcriptional regulator